MCAEAVFAFVPRNLFSIRKALSDSLLKNSFYLLLSSLANALFGFFFWVIAARLCNADAVGAASALISAMGLIIVLSRFGLDYSLVRFFPEERKNSYVNTSLNVTTAVAIVFGVVFIFVANLLFPEIEFLESLFGTLLFLLFVCSYSAITISGSLFYAVRRSDLYLVQNLLVGARIPLLLALFSLGAFGIFSAAGASYVVMFVASLFFLARLGIRPSRGIDKTFIIGSMRYSLANYVSSLLLTAPTLILPIMAFESLGAEEAAYYSIAYTASSFLFMIPTAIGTSLFVEGSHGEALETITKRSVSYLLLALIPAGILFYLFGDMILGFFGASYSQEGLAAFRLMVIASLPFGVGFVYLVSKRIQKEITSIIVYSSVVFVLLIGLSLIFADSYGIEGLGYAWVVSYSVATLFLFIKLSPVFDSSIVR